MSGALTNNRITVEKIVAAYAKKKTTENNTQKKIHKKKYTKYTICLCEWVVRGAIPISQGNELQNKISHFIIKEHIMLETMHGTKASKRKKKKKRRIMVVCVYIFIFEKIIARPKIFGKKAVWALHRMEWLER